MYRKLQSLTSDLPICEDNLSCFADLLINQFVWKCVTPEEIEKCKNIVLDLVTIDGNAINYLLKRFISQFRTDNREYLKVDICSRTFESIFLLKKHIRDILTESQDDINLQGENYDLLLELLKYHPRGIELHKNVVSIFPSTHRNPKFNGLRCFFYRNKDGFCEFFSYARCSDNVKTRGEIFREHICNIIIEIYKLSPVILSIITDLLETYFPHHNISIEHHVSFTKAILYIARHIEPARPIFYRLIINKLTIIDAQIKLANPNSVDVEKTESVISQKLKEYYNKLNKGDGNFQEINEKLRNPNWFKDMYEKLRTEEDTDDMSQKLDVLMGIMFEELQVILKANIDKPASLTSRSMESSSNCDDSCSSESDFDDLTDRNLSTPRSCNIKNEFVKSEVNTNSSSSIRGAIYKSSIIKADSDVKHVKNEIFENGADIRSCTSSSSSSSVKYSVSDIIVIELIDTFEDIILPTYNCKYVQFLYFFIFSFNAQWFKTFLERLFTIVFDNNQHVVKRRTAASYISSLICRSKYVNPKFVCGTVNYFFALLSLFDHLLLKSYDSSSSVKSDSIAGSSVGDLSSRRKNKYGDYGVKSSSKLSLFYSIFQNILYIYCYHADILAVSPSCLSFVQNSEKGLIAYLDSSLSPLMYCKESIITEAINATKNFPNLTKLHDCLMNFKKLAISSLEYEDINWLYYSPINAFFPFDPYLLHHSSYYIRDKYRHKLVNESSDLPRDSVKCEVDIKIKKEIVESPVCDQGNDVYSTNSTQPTESYHVPTQSLVNKVVDAIKDDREIVGDELKNVNKQVDDSIGFTSIPRVIKARLDQDKRALATNTISEIEADYDFWGYDVKHNFQIDDPKSLKKTKRKRIGSTEGFKKEEHILTNFENPDLNNRTQHIILGIDQLDDFELSLSSSIFLKPRKNNRSSMLDLLTSSAAYKSAFVNSEKAKKSKNNRNKS
ncbi:hypothetical protein BEWA_005240 [Theileria equi strain WA]|uniref:Uncharacterized protein n=1 Tax=Theileria equi strain WA TaxID=1537102 RepID=L0B1I8_THEEQ|nr:hypothetical protein BEWA_005240 [Theileria equi strain WA]AFZ81116.1 hypothetical protein BEWA_005240 [Theileria equi strain WA]|eukprot:XP_004830782.1 hypothetical protein BEWA_005240 [Theileria equi strain WA]